MVLNKVNGLRLASMILFTIIQKALIVRAWIVGAEFLFYLINYFVNILRYFIMSGLERFITKSIIQ